jgi:predicted nucleotide-binding protein (sugar kinase/HSP70/actin superfamily)
MTFFKDIMTPKPCLQLELDEHSADAGVITRLEAFLESLKHYKDDGEQAEKGESLHLKRKAYSAKRKLYIPYMSDVSFGVAASFRAHGQPAEVMPIADEEALLEGRRFTSGKECLPCAITTGDMLQVLKTQKPADVAFFMPGGSGPCRFGMYNCMHRLILRYAGADGVPVISPNQDGSFYEEFTKSGNGNGTIGFMKSIWISAVGIDLLRKVILRLRPFATDAEAAQAVYDRVLARWIKAAERRMNMAQALELMESIADEFSGVELDRRLQKPRIGIVGEIYVRSHPFANMNVVGRLEELGAACELAPLAEWIYYTNFTRKLRAKRGGEFGGLLQNLTQHKLQTSIEKKLARPLEKRFGRLAEGPIEHTIELGKRYLHESFEGEAILSVGKMVEYHHQGAGGVVNVMPFSCMPSTIVSTQTRRISADCDDMPILNLSFDGQEDPTLTTRLEAFVEQVRQKHGTNVTVGQLVTV